MSDDAPRADVLELKVPFKKPTEDERVLEVVYQKCFHRTFLVDASLSEVTCRQCGEKLDPMYVLKQIASNETRYHALFERYQSELQRLNERSRTKCEHCRKMTRISHR